MNDSLAKILIMRIMRDETNRANAEQKIAQKFYESGDADSAGNALQRAQFHNDNCKALLYAMNRIDAYRMARERIDTLEERVRRNAAH